MAFFVRVFCGPVGLVVLFVISCNLLITIKK